MHKLGWHICFHYAFDSPKAIRSADWCTCTAVYDEEMFVVQLQNELAKLEVDILHTQSHSLRLEQTLKLLEQDISEKMQTISKYEVRICTRGMQRCP